MSVSVDTLMFLKALHPKMDANFLEVRRLPGAVQNFCTSAAEAAQIALADQTRNVYFGVCLRSDKKGTEECATRISALWLDLDWKHFGGGREEAGRVLGAFEFSPSIVVETGNGWQVYWLFREPEEITKESRAYFRGLLLGLSETFGVDHTHDLARIMRVPGTIHAKNEKGDTVFVKDCPNPKSVRIIRWHPERRYNPSDFDQYCISSASQKKVPAAVEGRILDGQRNQILTSLAGTMRRRGMSENAIVVALLAENTAKCDPSLPEPEVRSIARSVARYEPEIVTTAPIDKQNSSNVSKVPQIVLKPRPLSKLLAESLQVIWQVDGILPVSSALVLVADAGIGKTWLLLTLALSVALGIPWLGYFTTRQGKVLVIDEENADPLLKLRFEKLLRGMDLTTDGGGLNIEFLTSAGVNLSDERFIAALEKLLAEMRPDLVLIDALVRVHRGNENDAGDMAQIFSIIKQWMVAFGCSFVFCHHKRKPSLVGGGPESSFRGSSEIRAFVDSHLDIKPIKNESGFVTVTHAKSRYAQPVPSFDVEIVDIAEDATAVRYIGETKGQVTEKLEGAKELILSLVQDGEKHGRQEIIDKGTIAGFGRQTLDTARKELIETGALMDGKEGREAVVWLSKNVTTVPHIYKGSSNVSGGKMADTKSEGLPEWATGDLDDWTEQLAEEGNG